MLTMVSKKVIIKLRRYLIVYHCLRGAYLSIKLKGSNRNGQEMTEHRSLSIDLGPKFLNFISSFATIQSLDLEQIIKSTCLSLLL